jgi:polar amino acid transport system substrate-binding protein
MQRHWRAAIFFIVTALSQGAWAETVTIVAEDDWWPYSASRNGVATGFSVDVMSAAMHAVNIEVDFKVLPFSRCVALVKAGQEIGCFNMLKDETTEKDFLFPDEPLFKGIVAIYARKDYVGTATIKSMEGKGVGTTFGYTYGPEIENNPKIKRYVSHQDVVSLKNLALGRLDFALLDTRVEASLMKENWATLGGKIKPVGVALPAPLYTFFSKTHPDGRRVMEALNRGLKIIRSNGTYSKIDKKWDELLTKQH